MTKTNSGGTDHVWFYDVDADGCSLDDDADVKKGYTPFHDGDLLVAKITPCFENGKTAQARLAPPLLNLVTCCPS